MPVSKPSARALTTVLICLLPTLALARGPVDDAAEEPERSPAAEALVQTLSSSLPGDLQRVVEEVLERNPRVELMRRRAASLAARPDQMGALPDPMASVNLFVLPPETRTGPQRLMASIAQRFPWFGKLGLARRAAVLDAEAAAADVESARLDALTETRRLYYEIAFQDELARIAVEERQTLRRHEEAARARYSAGMGLQQETVRIQAQLTRVETRLLDIRERRATLLALLNALRDRPSDTPLDNPALPSASRPELELEALRASAQAGRPELVAADASIASQEARVELAKKRFKPDVTLGLGYTVVDRRADAPGRASPPPDNGDDILALTGSVNLPIHRRALRSGLEEALEMRNVAEEAKRQTLADIERGLGDTAFRIPMLYEHWTLQTRVLLVQAEEALRSAETAYATGRLNAVDLLDAEVVLFDVQKATARTLTDFAVASAQLERAAAEPLSLLER